MTAAYRTVGSTIGTTGPPPDTKVAHGSARSTEGRSEIAELAARRVHQSRIGAASAPMTATSAIHPSRPRPVAGSHLRANNPICVESTTSARSTTGWSVHDDAGRTNTVVADPMCRTAAGTTAQRANSGPPARYASMNRRSPIMRSAPEISSAPGIDGSEGRGPQSTTVTSTLGCCRRKDSTASLVESARPELITNACMLTNPCRSAAGVGGRGYSRP